MIDSDARDAFAELPHAVQEARAALAAAIGADPEQCRDCIRAATALGEACRDALMNGRAARDLFRVTIGGSPAARLDAERGRAKPREQVMLAAADAYYGAGR